MFNIVNPRQTILVSCRGKIKIFGKEMIKDNLITLDWHMPTSFSPEMYAISIGKNRFSTRLILESSVFAINFMPYELSEKVLFCGRNSGEHMDKFEKAELGKLDAHFIDCPLVKESVAYLECQLVSQHNTGDHIIFVSKIVNSKHQSNSKRLFHTTGNSFLSL